MLKDFIYEASKGYKNKKSETKRSKTMDKYALLKRFHNDRWIQVYVYAFMYVNPKTIPVEDNFLDAKRIFDKYKKILTPAPVPKYWLVFSYMCSNDYELDVKFGEILLKRKSYHISNDKVKSSRENILVIEEE